MLVHYTVTPAACFLYPSIHQGGDRWFGLKNIFSFNEEIISIELSYMALTMRTTSSWLSFIIETGGNTCFRETCICKMVCLDRKEYCLNRIMASMVLSLKKHVTGLFVEGNLGVAVPREMQNLKGNCIFV